MKKAFKKILAMGLATLLGIGTMNMMMVSATETETETTPVYNVELLENGGFETLDDKNFPAGWIATVTDGGTGASMLETTVVAEGNHAMKIVANNVSAEDAEKADTEKRSRIYRRFQYEEYPNSRTVITGRIYIDDLVGGSFVQIECAHTSLGPANHMGAELIFDKEDTGWITFEKSIPEPNNFTSGSVVFFVSLNGIGTVYVDELSIQDKEQVLPSVMEDMAWGVWGGNCKNNVTHGYYANEAYAGAEITPYSGNNCFYVWPAGESGAATRSPRPYYAIPERALPKSGEKYRITLRFKTLNTTNTEAVPDIIIGKGTGTTTNSNRLVRLNTAGDWVTENVTTDGWKELSAYFTMPTFEAADGLSLIIYGNGNNASGWFDDLMIEKDYDEGAKILDSKFEEIETAEPGDTVKIKGHKISGKTEEAGGETATVLVACYNKVNGTLQCIDMDFESATVYCDEEITSLHTAGAKDVVLDYTIPENAAGCTIKAFFWNKASGLAPFGVADTIMVSAASEN